MKVKENDKLIPKWDTELYNDNYTYVYNYGKSLVELLNPKKNERILDLGCGSGQLTFIINEISKKTIGIDKSVEMIADAKLRYGKVKFQVCNAENFRFKNKFDSIFSNATLHWIKNYKSVIKCMYKNLKFNGKIVLEFGGKNNVKTIVDQLRSSLKKRGYLNQSKLELWYFPSAEEYSKELELVGFKVVLAESFNRKTELTNQKDGVHYEYDYAWGLDFNISKKVTKKFSLFSFYKYWDVDDSDVVSTAWFTKHEVEEIGVGISYEF